MTFSPRRATAPVQNGVWKNPLFLAKDPKLWFTFQNVSNLIDPRQADPPKTGVEVSEFGAEPFEKACFAEAVNLDFATAGFGNRFEEFYYTLF
jgi:hypothetical protein